jgi:PAS domain S-box-containing protein
MNASSTTPNRKNEKRIIPATFLALNPYPIIEANTEGKLTYTNQAAETAFPTLEQQGLAHPIFADWQEILQTLKNHNPRRDIQIGKNWFIQQFLLVPETDRIRMYFTPIDELMQTEQELERERNLLEAVMNGSKNIHLVYLDRNFNFVRVNETYAKGCGYTPQEMVGKNHFELYPNIENETIFKKVRDTGSPFEIKDKPFTFPDQPQRGVTYWDWTLQPVKNSKGKVEGLVFSLIETTERKKSETKLQEYANNMEALAEERAKQLSQAERLAAIGQTAGMVGHDIRNPLQAIAGELYLCKGEIEAVPNEETRKNMRESLQSIEQNLYYIDKIVADLQDFTKPLNPTWENVSIERVVEEALLMVNIPNNLQVNISIQQGFPILKNDHAMLKRALTNLLQNSVQAMPNGGNLKITAQHSNDKAEISIQDSGEGIPPEIQSKLFTPLFTTKSKGQGFGLAVVKRLIEAQNGTITYQTQTGKGTTFTIQLPITNK